jgi:hypothetical protein
LLDYVDLVVSKYRPFTQADWESGCDVPRAIGDFVTRYFDNEVDKRAIKKYLEATEVQDTIKAFGYDKEKFWYLTLFILDYSTGACLNCFKQNSSPKENIDNLSKRMFQNFESIDFNKSKYAELKSPMRLILEIDGKRKTVIEDTNSLLFIFAMLTNGLGEFGENFNLNYSSTWLKHIMKDGKVEFEYHTLSNSVLIWHFAKTFLDFFELKPPIKGTSKKGSLISLNKNLLISRLIYIIGLSRNESFYNSDETLKGYLKQYKNFKINTINGYYL